ncbi:hypothetical protein Nepgr_014367 [Nepenthes gracilis]|uniref:E3 SUMO-protein ligase SIZ1 n=1 Tax=Nepenthes gracilis TaxID=150966 RepID=A0AAD3XQ82_NEPGR|nr:hypothetical protein Nepgr_014367 [Nepenthes gracilis]
MQHFNSTDDFLFLLMSIVACCKHKLQYFRIKELKDVLGQLGLPKQGKKQDLVDRILVVLSDDQVSKMWGKRNAIGREEVAALVDDTYRKMQVSGATDLATKGHGGSDSSTFKPKEEVDDTFQLDMKIRCLCGSSLLTESMIKCEDPKCQVWQHIGCVITPEKPMEGSPPVPSQFYCELCRLNRADPFWLTVENRLYPVKLTATNVPADGSNPVQGVEKTFQLTMADKDLVSKPEFDVQAWCMLLNDKVPFRMQWPQYAELHVNGVPVRAINRPAAQLLGANGRDDGPIITPCTRDGINKISLTGCDARIFCLGVRIVKRRTVQQILSMIPKEQDGECFEDALARVRRCIGGGSATENADSDSDLEVVSDSFTINLRCPMSGSRMKIAGRFKPCVHMGCFDLETFVEMNQRSRKWQCPICLKNYSLEHIIIDPYFNRITSMMQSYGEDSTEIEVKPDGSWRVKADNEHRCQRQWHFPDGSLYENVVDVKPKLEATKQIKQEGTGLKLGIRKNSNGIWEVSKHEDMNTVSRSERVQDLFERNGQKFVPMGSSATGSIRDDEDPSVNQDTNGIFDFAANTGIELDSTSLNLHPTYGFLNQNASAAAKEVEVMVLSDSDEDNGNMVSGGAVASNGRRDTVGVNFSVASHGISDAYQDPALGTGVSGMDFFSPSDDEFGMHLWQLPPPTQGGSNFQLFGPDADVSDSLLGPHTSSLECPTPMNGYILSSEAAALNSAALVQDSSVGHSNNDLVDNLLAFGGEDPSLQIFLPTKPSDAATQTDIGNPQDGSNGTHTEDWISLRLGDGGGNRGALAPADGLNSGNQLLPKEGAMNTLAETASLLLDQNDTGADRTRQRSDSPFTFPRQKRSVRPRLYFSVETDSE